MCASAASPASDRLGVPHTEPLPDLAARGLGGVLKVSTENLSKAREYFRTTIRCPRTTTLVASNERRTWFRFVPVRCKCWTCPHCCKINAWQLEKKLAEGKPSTFITLTCRPSDTETPKEAHDRCRGKISKLFAELRKRHGVIEYACILETHKNGFPHWHILARCSYLPQHEIKTLWEKMTGNSIVSIEKIRHQRQMGKYLVKYCGKEMQLPTFNRLGRVISFSRNYLSPTRVTLPKDGVSWVKWTEPMESVLEKYRHCYEAFELTTGGQVIAYHEDTETRQPHELALLKWLNEYRPPLE